MAARSYNASTQRWRERNPDGRALASDASLLGNPPQMTMLAKRDVPAHQPHRADRDPEGWTLAEVAESHHHRSDGEPDERRPEAQPERQSFDEHRVLRKTLVARDATVDQPLRPSHDCDGTPLASRRTASMSATGRDPAQSTARARQCRTNTRKTTRGTHDGNTCPAGLGSPAASARRARCAA